MLDALYLNLNAHTMDPRAPRTHAIGVHRGRIFATGDDALALDYRTTVDLGGRTVVPGFNDAHLHLTLYGETLLQVDLLVEQAPDLDTLLHLIDQASRQAKPGAWVIGSGYDQNHLGAHPSAEQLDAVSHGHPVYLFHVSRHMGVGNTRAFELAGYPERRNVPEPDGGSVLKDSDGRAIGLVQETARELLMSAIPKADPATVADGLDAASTALLRLGITSITEPGLGAPGLVGQSALDMAGYQLAKDQGRLKVRSTIMPYISTFHPLDATHAGHRLYGLDHGIRSGLGDERLRIGGVKILSDGSLIGESAYLSCDYTHQAGHRGLLQFTEAELRERVIGAHLAGWQLAIHSIGDGAIDIVIDAIEEAQTLLPRPDARHRIEHFAVANDRQIARITAAGIIPVPQGRFVTEVGDGALRSLGAEREHLIYRVKSLLNAGIVLPASTDAPIVSADPIRNLDALVNRITSGGRQLGPAERITAAEALHAYTVGSAYASHQEQEKGRLVPGMLADFAVLSSDLLALPDAEIASCRVVATAVGGELVWEAPGLA